ncbi:hypothetical protein GCM10022198_00460 [Klugiella xanthotipulae]|uniref:Uncharacterized protein n=1 Tax=Klugiella xanthotipulae TaxID=244735 RepID=A0A543I5E5_9MICO|nr:hypothetical protein [Klugiella xanthotipulae]TQM65815.1 hypothetical protein FB466_0628 [Klugiella xanthotipulae]
MNHTISAPQNGAKPEPIPVLLNSDGDELYIQELVRTTEGITLGPGSLMTRLGRINKVAKRGDRGGARVVWEWWSEGWYGEARSRAAAISDMLADAGYVQVPDTAIIPPLFEVGE